METQEHGNPHPSDGGGLKEVLLASLDPSDPKRNEPLHHIGAEVSTRGMKQWHRIGPRWGIAENCYNDLGTSWTDPCDFRIMF